MYHGFTASYLYFLFICRSESIQSIGYDGKNFNMLVTSPKFLGEPLALSKYKKNLFWSDDVTNSIGKVRLKIKSTIALWETDVSFLLL